jgi:uncharacterized protein YbjQ (UPF0145 family)
MIIVTTDTIANQNIVEVKGLVTSSIVSVAEYRKRYSVRIEVGHWRRIKKLHPNA